VLLHVLDCATLEAGRDPVSDLDALEAELGQYVSDPAAHLGELQAKPRLVALNKMDVPEARELAELVRPELQARGLRVFEISAVTHDGLRELTFALAEAVEADRARRPAAASTRIVLQPKAVDDVGYTVIADPAEAGGFIVLGDKPERWVRQTSFDNDEAVGYLADRLARIGVEAELSRLGAEPGAAVTIGEVTFDFEPTAGIDESVYTPTRRGSDERLENITRPNPAQRLAAKKARRSRPDDLEADWSDRPEDAPGELRGDPA
jgi:GTPase